MPSLLLKVVSESGADLDEKAQLALRELNGVLSLSILGRRHSQGIEVRNPSAFVDTAVRSARDGGGQPGPNELETALQFLNSSGIIDESAVDVLKKSPLQDSCAALIALLAQDTDSMRNASAYVTRNVMNSQKQGGSMFGGAALAPMLAGPAPSPSAALPPVPANAVDLFAKWCGSLDPDAIDALNKVGVQQAAVILQNLEVRANTENVRNPSAYVVKSVANHQGQGQQPPLHQTQQLTMQQMHMQPTQQMFASSGGLGCCGAPAVPALDAKAEDALRMVPPEIAQRVLQEVVQRAGTVRNPSAYVTRALENYQRTGEVVGSQMQMTNAVAPVAMGACQSSLTPSMLLGGSAHDPTAFGQVVGGFDSPAAQAGLGFGGGADFPVPQAGMGFGAFSGAPSMSAVAMASNSAHQLDDAARQALDACGPEDAAAIISSLNSQQGKVNNPSAYVLKAAVNARRGKGNGAPAVPTAEVGGLGSMLDAWRSQLDANAQSALQSVSPDVAQRILGELEARAGTVRNPSAYVSRAAANAKTNSTVGSLSSEDAQRAQMELEQHLAALPTPLDAKALAALNEVGPVAALKMVEVMARGQPGNPSAYIMKAVVNERRGVGMAADVGLAKRPRLM